MTKTFKDTTVLDRISMRFESGNIYGITGRNGSGKTMLLRAVAGLIVPTKGTISVDGLLLHKDLAFPPDMGVFIDKPEFLNHLTGMDNLKFLAAIKKITTLDEIKEWMERFDLDPNSKKTMKKYSEGMKQKIGIIQAIMENQKLLILDEPFNALDEKSSDTLKELILQFKSNDKLIILTSHYREDIEMLCDETFNIKDGSIDASSNLG
jgi:ABC-2 type transport system ATP-binding protein